MYSIWSNMCRTNNKSTESTNLFMIWMNIEKENAMNRNCIYIIKSTQFTHSLKIDCARGFFSSSRLRMTKSYLSYSHHTNGRILTPNYPNTCYPCQNIDIINIIQDIVLANRMCMMHWPLAHLVARQESKSNITVAMSGIACLTNVQKYNDDVINIDWKTFIWLLDRRNHYFSINELEKNSWRLERTNVS